jgi:hypothetical protein
VCRSQSYRSLALLEMPNRKQKRIDEFAAQQLMNLGIVPVLSHLTDIGAFESYLRNKKVTKYDQLSLGYAFLVASTLERLIDAILLSPALFGVGWNELAHRSHQTDVSFDEFPARSDIGRMIIHLAALYRELLPVRTVSDLRKRTENIRKLLLPELIRWKDRFDFQGASNRLELSRFQVERDLGAIYLLYFVHDTKYVKVALNHTFHRGERYEPQFHDLPLRIGSQQFFDGFRVGVAYLWYKLLGETTENYKFMTVLSDAKNWDEFYLVYPIVGNEIVAQAEQRISALTYTTMADESAFEWLRSKRLAMGRRRMGIMDRLEDRFVRYEVRIVSEKYTAKAASGFLLALLGAMEFRPEKARVIKFVHSEPNNRSRYSYAILVRVPILAGDDSEWWLFFDFCDDYSPRGLSAYRPIESFMRDHNARLETSTFKVKAGQLLQYVHTHPDFSKSTMSPLTRDFNNLGTLSGLRLLLAASRAEKDFARGLVIELLTYSLASKNGYNAKWRFKRAFLGKEIDVLGFKYLGEGKGEWLVVECSTEFSPSLLEEVAMKMRLVESKTTELYDAFEVKRPLESRVTGWLVTTEKNELGGVTHPSSVSIFGWNRLAKSCRESGIEIPPGLRELLTKEEFPPGFVINPSSVGLGTTPPPSNQTAGEPALNIGLQILADGFILPEKWKKNTTQQSKTHEA